MALSPITSVWGCTSPKVHGPRSLTPLCDASVGLSSRLRIPPSEGPVLATYRRLLLLLVSFVDRGVGASVLLLPALALRFALGVLILVFEFTRSMALPLACTGVLALGFSVRAAYLLLNLIYRALRDYLAAGKYFIK